MAVGKTNAFMSPPPSTTETWTGRYWVGGQKLYQIEVITFNFVDATANRPAIGINLASIVPNLQRIIDVKGYGQLRGLDDQNFVTILFPCNHLKTLSTVYVSTTLFPQSCAIYYDPSIYTASIAYACDVVFEYTKFGE